ncbi:MAG: hypothetical protein RR247_01975 [Clostridia bacterium]
MISIFCLALICVCGYLIYNKSIISDKPPYDSKLSLSVNGGVENTQGLKIHFNCKKDGKCHCTNDSTNVAIDETKIYQSLAFDYNKADCDFQIEAITALGYKFTSFSESDTYKVLTTSTLRIIKLSELGTRASVTLTFDIEKPPPIMNYPTKRIFFHNSSGGLIAPYFTINVISGNVRASNTGSGIEVITTGQYKYEIIGKVKNANYAHAVFSNSCCYEILIESDRMIITDANIYEYIDFEFFEKVVDNHTNVLRLSYNLNLIPIINNPTITLYTAFNFQFIHYTDSAFSINFSFPSYGYSGKYILCNADTNAEMLTFDVLVPREVIGYDGNPIPVTPFVESIHLPDLDPVANPRLYLYRFSK